MLVDSKNIKNCLMKKTIFKYDFFNILKKSYLKIVFLLYLEEGYLIRYFKGMLMHIKFCQNGDKRFFLFRLTDKSFLSFLVSSSTILSLKFI